MRIADYCEWAGIDVSLEEDSKDVNIDVFTAACFLDAKKKRYGMDYNFDNALQVLAELENETA